MTIGFIEMIHLTAIKNKKVIIILAVALVLVAVGVTVGLMLLNSGDVSENISDEISGTSEPEPVIYYDSLTGEEIVRSGIQYKADGSKKTDENGNVLRYTELQAKEYAEKYNSQRINCIQIPNGVDGARPQVGLTEAKIVFEAIAEAGITRFAAIYQGATSSAIGPVRSLRMYYLEWDIPFDCTIVHAGGEANALNAVASYAHLSESTTYMWRDYSAYWAPNNLFTSADLLAQFNADAGYTTSNPQTWSRMTPAETEAELAEIAAERVDAESVSASANEDNNGSDTSDTSDTSDAKYTLADDIYIHVTSATNFNVKYKYDVENNKYLRSYEYLDEEHITYTCKSGLDQPAPQADCGEATQVAPSVVVVIKVNEQLNQINLYREDLETTGSGEAYIFQNGIAIKGTWTKESIDKQIVFTDADGAEIELAPGQTWVTAIAKSYGYVEY